MKRVISILMIALLICSVFVGCGSSSDGADSSDAGNVGDGGDSAVDAETDDTSGGTDNADAGDTDSDKVIKIGVVQIVQHEALDAAFNGFQDALKEAETETGYTFEIDYQNAQGDPSNCNTIANKFVNDGVDLILAIATPAAQAAQNATKDNNIPVLFTAVTDAVDAGLVADVNEPGGNVTGTSDLNPELDPINKQMELLTQLLPDAKNVAILYSSNEENSVFQANMAKEAAKEYSLETTDYTISNLNEISQVVQSMVGKVDAIYIPTDNQLAQGMATVSNIAAENDLAIIAGENGMVENGALASYGLSYYELGKLTASQAIKVCVDGEDISKTAVEYVPTLDLLINEEIAGKLEIVIPDELKAILDSQK